MVDITFVNILAGVDRPVASAGSANTGPVASKAFRALKRKKGHVQTYQIP